MASPSSRPSDLVLGGCDHTGTLKCARKRSLALSGLWLAGSLFWGRGLFFSDNNYHGWTCPYKYVSFYSKHGMSNQCCFDVGPSSQGCVTVWHETMSQCSLMLAQCQRWWPNIKTTLGQHSHGYCVSCEPIWPLCTCIPSRHKTLNQCWFNAGPTS